jgi:hypothetical protein
VPLFLKNDIITLQVELPQEGYSFPRFDQTGKISSVTFKGMPISGVEKPGATGKHGGRGLFNEFGIDGPLGFAETKIGDWCHKIGVGLLQKVSANYHFLNDYKIQPCDFAISHTDNSVRLTCNGPLKSGYGYVLNKEIIVQKSGFDINYQLKNIGQKAIKTTEYGHNFLVINNNAIGPDYSVRLPFIIKRLPAAESVNPEQKILLGQSEIMFTDMITKEFFFEDLSGGELALAQWELRDLENKISISETCSAKLHCANLWGNAHVVCPELFINVDVAPGKTQHWQRTYLLRTFP